MPSKRKSRASEPGRVQVNVRLPVDLRKQVRVKAAQEETSIQEAVEGLLRAWVEGKARPRP